jgi:hypothetical protein
MFSSQNSQVSSDANYIEDVFSTYLYTGNGSTQTITNGIDLAGEGGLVWTKARGTPNGTVRGHYLFDGSGSSYSALHSNTTGGRDVGYYINYNADGFSFPFGDASWNNSGDLFASWTFRKQPKFFDIVTYTGANTSRMVSHSLGSTPGFVIIKKTSGTSNWLVAARDGTSSGKYTYTLFNSAAGLNLTAAANYTNYGLENSGWITSTGFNPYILSGSGGNDNNNYDYTGDTYIAYLFAHDAGGFGLTGTDNVISCGSFTCDGSGNATVDLGYEPQWIIRKASNEITNWELFDNMRGLSVTDNETKLLYPNLANAEENTSKAKPTATGFIAKGEISKTYIYIAIRRGPMKVPTSGTSVFSPNQTSATTGTQITTGFPVDWQLLGMNDGNVYNQRSSTRLTGVNTDGTSNSQYLVTSKTIAEGATGSVTLNWGSTGFQVPSLNSGSPTIFWNFKRSPSVFDVVCYTGTGNNNTSITHNLAVVPELIIVKDRSAVIDWGVYHQAIGQAYAIYLNQSSAAAYVGDFWGTTAFTSTTFRVGNYSALNTNTEKYVAYLFATCAGVSKVGSYTGTGATQTISCGFTGGARFVMIKRTDSTGDWYVWDSARGIVAGNDPYLLMNSSAAEVTSTDYIDTYSAGFEISSTAPAAINASGGTFIFLAIA